MASTAERIVIDLQNVRGGKKVKVLTGREAGEYVRRSKQIDKLDEEALRQDAIEAVEVQVPSDLWSVTSSFFLGAFGESIRRLGAEKFRARYHFTGKSIVRVIEDAIRSVQITEPLR